VIFTGGSALNCVFNDKLRRSGLYRQVYVPPFPGDECISLGAASHVRHELLETSWSPRPWSAQRADFGPLASVPSEAAIRRLFGAFSLSRPRDLATAVAERLARGEVVGWFQGRSESGPRALGSRSILAHPGRPGMKDHLNQVIKGRESFRPYGGSCTRREVGRYFDVPTGFESPFMSFAPRVRAAFAEALGQITHADGTSRIQTVEATQHPRFHALLEAFGRRAGVPCLLNTSMNVMGEPIVETAEDALNFFRKVPVDALVVENVLIERPRS
jgi:carbamoyltransferase